MDYRDVDTSNCSLGRTVELVGQPWVVLILREVVWGVRRFSEMQAHMGVSKSVLCDRLDHLVEHGVLERRDYQAARPAQALRVPPDAEGRRPLPGADLAAPVGRQVPHRPGGAADVRHAQGLRRAACTRS